MTNMLSEFQSMKKGHARTDKQCKQRGSMSPVENMAEIKTAATAIETTLAGSLAV